MNIFDTNLRYSGQPPGQPPGQPSGLDLLSINHPQGGNVYDVKEPEFPDFWNQRNDDVSGFASYGMEAPPLPDPSQQIGNLMKMSMVQPAAQRQQTPMGGNLMNYLMMLSGGQGG